MVTQYVMTSLRVNDLKKWQADNASALDTVHDGQAAWKQLAPVVDPKNNPLELLLETDKSVNTDQLHLTDFEAGGGHLVIKGEAKNIAGAFEFLSKLNSDPFFSGYNLAMNNPRPLPNDLAQFQIEGTRSTTN